MLPESMVKNEIRPMDVEMGMLWILRECYESLGKGEKRVNKYMFYLFRNLWISDSESTRKMLPESVVKNEIRPMDESKNHMNSYGFCIIFQTSYESICRILLLTIDSGSIFRVDSESEIHKLRNA